MARPSACRPVPEGPLGKCGTCRLLPSHGEGMVSWWMGSHGGLHHFPFLEGQALRGPPGSRVRPFHHTDERLCGPAPGHTACPRRASALWVGLPACFTLCRWLPRCACGWLLSLRGDTQALTPLPKGLGNDYFPCSMRLIALSFDLHITIRILIYR